LIRKERKVTTHFENGRTKMYCKGGRGGKRPYVVGVLARKKQKEALGWKAPGLNGFFRGVAQNYSRREFLQAEGLQLPRKVRPPGTGWEKIQ